MADNQQVVQRIEVRLKAYLDDAERLKVQLKKKSWVKSELRLNQEHMRSQVYRFASALQQEQGKVSLVAKQELEQLRADFLAR